MDIGVVETCKKGIKSKVIKFSLVYDTLNVL